LAVIKSHTQKQLLGSTNLKAGHPCFQLFLCHKITHLPPITHLPIHFFLFFPVRVSSRSSWSPPRRRLPTRALGTTSPAGGRGPPRPHRRADEPFAVASPTCRSGFAAAWQPRLTLP
jgi:hypothetical protein